MLWLIATRSCAACHRKADLPIERGCFVTDETISDPVPRRVFLIRHAEASEGDKDPERGRHLTELGKLQADALARRAARWQLDAIYCSDLYRSCETAAAISFHHPDAVCSVDPLF